MTSVYDTKYCSLQDTKVVVDNRLMELPTSVCTFYMDNNPPHTPAIAVASGAYLYVYRNQRPYFKFTLPPLDLNAREKELWQQAGHGEVNAYKLQTQLQQLMHEVGQQALTTRSLKLLGMDAALAGDVMSSGYEGSPEMIDFVQQTAKSRLRRYTTVTCVCTMKKSANEEDSVSCVVIGTESAQVFIIDPEAFTVIQTFKLPSPPGSIYSAGTFSGNFRIVAGCRDNCIYTLKRGSDTHKYKIELTSAIVGLALMQKHISVGCMNRSVEAYNLHGKRQHHIAMPAPITTVEVRRLTGN